MNHSMMSHCSADVVGPGQAPVRAPSLSKLRLCVIAAWTGGVVDIAITRAVGPDDTNRGEKRRVIPSPEHVLENARVVAREFMTNVTEACLLYAVLARDSRLTTTAAELEVTTSSSEVMASSVETNHDCATKPGTGYHSTSWGEHGNFGEDKPMTNRVSNAATSNSSGVHGDVAHIYFPTPPCSISLMPPDSAVPRSFTGIPSILQQGETCSSATFSQLVRREAEEANERSTLAGSSVLNGGNPTNAMEDRAAANMLMRRIVYNPRRNVRKPYRNKVLEPVDAPRDRKNSSVPNDKPTAHCDTTGHAETRARETCIRGGSSARAQKTLEVAFASVGTRPAEAVPRSSFTAGLTRKGGGFLFRKRRCSPRIGYNGGHCGGGGGSTDVAREKSAVSLLSSPAVGHGGSEETLPLSSTRLSCREPVDTSGVVFNLDGVGSTVGRKSVLQVRRRHGHHVTGDRPLNVAGTGDTFSTSITYTTYGVAMGESSGATNDGSFILSDKSAEKSPVVCRYRVPVSDQQVPIFGPGRGREFPDTDGRTGAGGGACRGAGGDGSTATDSTSCRVEGSVSIRTAGDTDGVCSNLRVQPNPPHGVKTRSLTRSRGEVLYGGTAQAATLRRESGAV